MSSNLAQIFIANPINVIGDTDLFYVVESGTTDGAIDGATLKGYFASITDVQSNDYNNCVDVGAADAYITGLSPPINAYFDGLEIDLLIDPANANQTNTPTVNVDGIGVVSILLANGTQVAIGDMVGGYRSKLIYNDANTNFVLQNPSTSSSASYYATRGNYYRVDDVGNVNAYSSINAFYPLDSEATGQFVVIRPANTNTDASTYDYNATSFPIPIRLDNTTPIAPGDMLVNQGSLLMSQGSYWQLLNPFFSNVTAQKIQQQLFTKATNVGGVGTGTITFDTTPSFAAYENGMRFIFQADSDSVTTSYTVDVNGVGTLTLVNQDGSGIVARQMVNGGSYDIELDTNIGGFRLLNPTCGAVLGTITNDNAVDGYVGEYLDDVILAASAVSLTTATATNIATVQLTEGDWDVWGNVTFIPDPGVTIVTTMTGWINDDSATLPDPAFYSAMDRVGVMSIDAGMVAASQRFTVTNSTTLDIYLSCQADFSVSTLTACGGLYARRRR